MKINFTKMQGTANDYIYLDCMNEELSTDFSSLAVCMSRRRFSVGADGLVVVLPSKKANALMRIFNSDGSEGLMCGNAIRCVGKLLYDKKYINGPECTIETLSGIKQLMLDFDGDKVIGASVKMGAAVFNNASIPVISDLNEIINRKLIFEGLGERTVSCVSIGNPHCVIEMCCPELSDCPNIINDGKIIENSPLFPNRTNVEFYQITASDRIKMRVWERGSGETFSCGTGACAVAAVLVKRGIFRFNQEIHVDLIGGTLKIMVDSNYGIIMSGPLESVYEGVYDYEP